MLLSSPWYLCTSAWSSSPAHNHYSRVRIWCHVSQVTCHDMVSVHLCSKIILQAARAGSVTLVEVHLWVNCNVLEKPLQYIQYLRQVLHWLWREWVRYLIYFQRPRDDHKSSLPIGLAELWESEPIGTCKNNNPIHDQGCGYNYLDDRPSKWGFPLTLTKTTWIFNFYCTAVFLKAIQLPWTRWFQKCITLGCQIPRSSF